MASVNKVIIVGNLGKDPETRFMPNGDAVTNITVATSESWKDKTSGEKQEKTEWHRITFYRRLAEIAGIGVCIELHACWMEGNLRENLRRAVPLAGLVQASDYVLGDRTTPCRAVPGDGVMPLEAMIGDILEAGYTGMFDLELVGPRIAEEGARAATTRAATYLSELLTRLGV